jgi:uncharacterized SAM-binding protein YcdF (DUF218 family)
MRRRPAHRRRGRRLCNQLVALAVLLLLGWIAGFVDFLGRIPSPEGTDSATAEAIVVLTGGPERIREGLRLLVEKRAPLVFVSGVHQDTRLRELLAFVPEYRDRSDVTCCVVLGREAGNTEGNARETAALIAEKHLRSVLLVTADYHMPRSLLEFRRVLPGTTILAHPVFPQSGPVVGAWWRRPDLFGLVIVEYHKYLLALARSLLGGAPAEV